MYKVFPAMLGYVAVGVLTMQCSWAQSVSLFGNAVPSKAVENTTSPTTLGMKFWSTQAGTMSAIRFYRGATSPQGYEARLYSASGALLGETTLETESGPVPGWQTAQFASPISISANTTYIAAYYAPSGQYAQVTFGLKQGVTTGPLTAPASGVVGGNGVLYGGNAFPNRTSKASNYYVDVLFAPLVPTPYLQLSFNPPNPSISTATPLGSVVTTVTASWSDGTPFTGTLSFGSPYSNDNATFALSGNNLIINPAGPGVSSDGNTTLNTTIVATP
jgi:hypothetical protein